MEKRMWVQPELNEVTFAADNYCASGCYYGKCDIDAGHVSNGWINDKLEFLYRIFFAWNDTSGDGVVQNDEVDLNNIVNMSNEACGEEFNLQGSYQKVVTPDTLFYREGLGGPWKPQNAITDNTVWQSAYHFESGSGWNHSTHLCSNLQESSAS